MNLRASPLLVAVVVVLSLVACKKSGPAAPAGKRFAVRIQPTAPSTIRVTPGEGWKLNVKYENSLEAKGSPSGEAVSLGPKDAKIDDAELTFTVPVKPNESYEGKVSFAICNPSTCIPIRESVSWKVAGK